MSACLQLTNHGAHVCGELKTKVTPLVEAMFGFSSGNSKKILKQNRALAEDLKDGYNFAYEVFILHITILHHANIFFRFGPHPRPNVKAFIVHLSSRRLSMSCGSRTRWTKVSSTPSTSRVFLRLLWLLC